MEQNNFIAKQPFGLNISIPKKTVQQVKRIAQQEIEKLTANPFIDFLESSDKVFSGETAQEIRKYQARIYTLGQLMHDGTTGKSFDVTM